MSASDYPPVASSHNVRLLLPDVGTTAFDRLALGLCTVRWHPNACTLAQGHTGAHRAADGSALVATHGSGDLEPTGQPEAGVRSTCLACGSHWLRHCRGCNGCPGHAHYSDCRSTVRELPDDGG